MSVRARGSKAVVLPLLLAFSASAAVYVGGLFEVPSRVAAPGGTLSGGGFDLTHAIGQGQGSVGRMTGADLELNGGFAPTLSGGGPAPEVAQAMDPDETRYDDVTAQFLGFDPDKPLEVRFSQAMAPLTLDAGIGLHRIACPVGKPLPLEVAVPFTVAYDSVEFKATITPTAALTNNCTFRLSVSTAIADAGGVPLTQVLHSTFSTLADDAVASTMVASDGETTVLVPASAATTDYFVLIRVDPVNRPERLDVSAYHAAVEKAARSYSEYQQPVAASVREFTAYDRSRGLIEEFRTPVTIEVPFKDEDDDGFVDGTQPPVRVKTLAVWWLDERRKLWVRLPDPQVDLARKVVSARTPHFSTFGLIGAQDTDLSLVRVYPVPFRPNAGDSARYGSASEGIHFDNLPDAAEIRIYTLTGRLVKTIRHGPPALEQRWLAVNDDGQKVASGVYRWVIKSGENTRTGRLMVVW